MPEPTTTVSAVTSRSSMGARGKTSTSIQIDRVCSRLAFIGVLRQTEMLQLNFPQVVEGLFAKSLSIERPFRRAVDDALQKDGGGVLRAERRTAHAQSACGLLTRQSDRLEGGGSGCRQSLTRRGELARGHS